MNALKKIRERAGHTQEALAVKSGLSLRTVQRFEKNEKAPKGHTLQALAEALELTPAELQAQYVKRTEHPEVGKQAARLINLSVLAVFVVPFGNLILPFVLWHKNKDLKMADEVGREIVNFQIAWTIVLIVGLSSAPFINADFPLILYVLLVCLLLNLAVVGLTARAISLNNERINLLPFKFF